jgi:hypothetical protein
LGRLADGSIYVGWLSETLLVLITQKMSISAGYAKVREARQRLCLTPCDPLLGLTLRQGGMSGYSIGCIHHMHVSTLVQGPCHGAAGDDQLVVLMRYDHQERPSQGKVASRTKRQPETPVTDESDNIQEDIR